jgi:hypothetical protein
MKDQWNVNKFSSILFSSLLFYSILSYIVSIFCVCSAHRVRDGMRTMEAHVATSSQNELTNSYYSQQISLGVKSHDGLYQSQSESSI